MKNVIVMVSGTLRSGMPLSTLLLCFTVKLTSGQSEETDRIKPTFPGAQYSRSSEHVKEDDLDVLSPRR